MMGTVLHALFAHWWRHPVQLATLVLGLALATALWSGVQAINAEAKRSYAEASGVLGQTTLDRLTGPEVTLDDFIALRRAGWQVSPVIEGMLGEVQIVGIDPMSAPPQEGLRPLAEGEVDLITFMAPPGLLLVAPETVDQITQIDIPHQIVANLDPGIVLTDIPVAQQLLGQQDFTYLILAEAQALGVPPLSDITTLTRERPTDGSELAQITESFHLNLTAFGLLAFAVGLFIVQSAIGLAFEQRRSTFRTLRALGVGLRRLLVVLGLELAVIALISGLLGLALGYSIAAALLPGVSGTLANLYGAQVAGTLAFDPLWAISALAMTFIGATAAGAAALWRVSRMPLLAPAQPRAWARASRRQIVLQASAAAILIGIAVACAIWGNSLAAGFVCLAALLIGAALALPALLIGLLDVAARLGHGVLSEWVFADTRQQVPALSLALMALLLALAANIGVGTMVGSFRVTFTGWLEQRLASELYVTAQSAEQAEEIDRFVTPRVDAVLPIWAVNDTIGAQPARVYGVLPHETYRDHWPLLAATPTAWDTLAAGEGVLINEQLARRADLWPEQRVTLGADWSLPVVGVYSDYGNPNIQAIVDFETLRTRHPDPPILRFALRLPPEEASTLQAELRTRFDLAPDAVVDQEAVKQLSLRIFDQTFLVTGALNLLTLTVAAFAILTSLLTLSQMRLSQVAPVWALGISAHRLARFEVLRTILLALLTWVIALPVGIALAWVLLAVVNVHAFGWRLPLQLFPQSWAWLALWAVVAAITASLWPALQLSRGSGAALLRRFAHDR